MAFHGNRRPVLLTMAGVAHLAMRSAGLEAVAAVRALQPPSAAVLPALFTVLAALSQFVGVWLLVIGAYTRVAAFMVASTMFTATVFNLQTGGPDVQLAGLFTLVTGAFRLIGGGHWSIDRYFER